MDGRGRSLFAGRHPDAVTLRSQRCDRSARATTRSTISGRPGFFMLFSTIPSTSGASRLLRGRRLRREHRLAHALRHLMEVADLAIIRSRSLAWTLTTILRILNAPIYPFDFYAGGHRRDCRCRSPVSGGAGCTGSPAARPRSKLLRADFSRWQAEAAVRLRQSRDAETRRDINGRLRRLARHPVSGELMFLRGERFDHDPASVEAGVVRLLNR